MRRKSILITGYSGFIGKRLLIEVQKKFKDSKIYCLSYDKENKQRSINGINILYGDLIKPKTIKKLPKNPDIIFHLAANTNTSLKNHQVNQVGTINLYNAIGPLNENSHFVHVSSVAIHSGRKDFNKPVNEKTKPVPTNLYGKTKYQAELYLTKKQKVDNFRLTIFRLPTVWGPNARPDSMFPTLIRNIRSGSVLTKLNWPGRTSFIYVGDVAKLIVFVTKNDMHKGISKYLLYTETLELPPIIRQISKKLNIVYKPINLPQIFWEGVKIFLKLSPNFEKIIPTKLYNLIWRTNLIVNDTFYCKSKKTEFLLKTKTRKKLLKNINLVMR